MIQSLNNKNLLYNKKKIEINIQKYNKYLHYHFEK